VSVSDTITTLMYTYCVCWYDLDPIQGQGHGAFELPTISEAVHAGGDDCSPLAGLSGFFCVDFVLHVFFSKRCMIFCHI